LVVELQALLQLTSDAQSLAQYAPVDVVQLGDHQSVWLS
jgi:hypothetical protein